MIVKKMYRYLGRNGTITSPVKLENVSYIPMVQLNAEIGKILTNGINNVYTTTVFEDEIENWTEIDDVH